MTRFAIPVEIVISRSGRRKRVEGARDALRFLFCGAWPDRSGAPFDSAVGSCVRALSGDVPAEVARDAFVLAARRAKILPEGGAQ